MVQFENCRVPRSFIKTIVDRIDLEANGKAVSVCIDCGLDYIEEGKLPSKPCRKCRKIYQERDLKKRIQKEQKRLRLAYTIKST